MISMVRLVITYDISEDKIRTRLFRLLERYGAWKQYSVFEMEITPVQRVKIEHSIRSLIGASDKVRIYVLCERCQNQIVNLGESSPERMENVI